MTAGLLVVDYLLPNLKLLEARLSAGYFKVVSAANGVDALKICANGDCDIVLLDVMKPGMDGMEVCRRLKGDKATAHIPVVLVTALNQPSDRIRGLDAGADNFLSKPVDAIALLARVHSLSRLRLILDELRSRALRSAKLGIGDPFTSATAGNGTGARIGRTCRKLRGLLRRVLAPCRQGDLPLETGRPKSRFARSGAGLIAEWPAGCAIGEC